MLGVFLMSRKILYIVAAAWVLAFLWQTYAHADDDDEVVQIICSECQAAQAACEQEADKQHLRDADKDAFVDKCFDDYMDKHKWDMPTVRIR
jgi:hypothetical protein